MKSGGKATKKMVETKQSIVIMIIIMIIMFFWHIYKTQCAYITIKNKLVKSYKIFLITVINKINEIIKIQILIK